MDRITFRVNGEKCSVGGEVDSDEMLVDYLRTRRELRGTKYMCREGGCGACVVAVTAPHPLTSQLRTFAVNSCLISIAQCQDWSITTVEGIGNRREGYHPVQRALAEHNGTQCGYCSPGWVMSMYSLLESKKYDLTEYEIEDSFGSNTCRCTGYRPILEAFKSFAKDAPKPKDIQDIEDLSICNNKGENCQSKCKGRSAKCLGDWFVVNNEDVEEKVVKKIHLKDGKIWYRVNEVKEIFDVLRAEGTDSYMLVGGNTAKGPYHIFEYPRVLIDITSVSELREFYLDQNLVVGAGFTLTDLMSLFEIMAAKNEDFSYLQKLYDHLKLVANIPVRNVGTVAGNLMLKHRVRTFSSDVFLLLECVGAILTIVDMKGSSSQVSPADFLSIDMTGKVIINVILPPMSQYHKFVSFKIMPRAQNAPAQVNAAFLFKFDHHVKEMVLSARIVIGGLSSRFVHASITEEFLIGKRLFTNDILQKALEVLDKEIIVEEVAGEMKAEFRKKVALGLFYKAILNLIPEERIKPQYRSGARDFRKTRPISKTKEVFDTNPIIWPITEPMPKAEALVQCAGEIKYANDTPKQPGEVFAAFVTADVGTGEIESIDATPALRGLQKDIFLRQKEKKYPGVLAFFSAKDLPGANNFLSSKVPTIVGAEEILCSGAIKYYDQPIGIIVAETEVIANRAALLVQVKYITTAQPPILTINEARTKDPSRVSLYMAFPARSRGADVRRILRDTHNIFSQYYFTMETYTCVAKPSVDGLELIPSTHWPDLTHVAVADALNIEENRINMQIPPIGGSYGSRISRTNHVITACAVVSYMMNRPCRFVMTMQANMRVSGKRYPATRDFEVGVNDNGEIQYLEYNLYEDNGYVFSEQIIFLAISDVKNCYDNQRWAFKLYNVLTDTAANSWMRSPGTLEAICMTEYIMEQISYELEKDPLEVRMNNLNKQDPEMQDVIATLVKDGEYEKRKNEVQEFNKLNRWKKRGLRVALMSWASAVLGGFQVQLSVYHGDGTVAVRHGGVEVGQGVNTRVVQVVAYTLNIPMTKVKVKPNDLVSNPNCFTTGGSRTTEAVCFGAMKCCQLLMDRLAPIREKQNDLTWEAQVQAAFTAGINLQTSYFTTSNEQNPYRVSGAVIAEVEVDVLTGEHEVLRVDLVEDVGTSVNPELDIGQIEGAFIMGMGYWTSEHLIYDAKTGELLTDRTWYYDVPLAKDIPIDFRVQLRRNSYNPIGTLGAKAVAEPPACLAIAVAFAIREAMVSSRADSGYPRSKWFNVDGPYTLENIVLKSDIRLDEFLID